MFRFVGNLLFKVQKNKTLSEEKIDPTLFSEINKDLRADLAVSIENRNISESQIKEIQEYLYCAEYEFKKCLFDYKSYNLNLAFSYCEQALEIAKHQPISRAYRLMISALVLLEKIEPNDESKRNIIIKMHKLTNLVAEKFNSSFCSLAKAYSAYKNEEYQLSFKYFLEGIKNQVENNHFDNINLELWKTVVRLVIKLNPSHERFYTSSQSLEHYNPNGIIELATQQFRNGSFTSAYNNCLIATWIMSLKLNLNITVAENQKIKDTLNEYNLFLNKIDKKINGKHKKINSTISESKTESNESSINEIDQLELEKLQAKEVQERAEQEARAKAELEQAEREARAKAEQELAEREARAKADQEKTEREARAKAEQEAQLKAEQKRVEDAFVSYALAASKEKEEQKSRQIKEIEEQKKKEQKHELAEKRLQNKFFRKEHRKTLLQKFIQKTEHGQKLKDAERERKRIEQEAHIEEAMESVRIAEGITHGDAAETAMLLDYEKLKQEQLAKEYHDNEIKRQQEEKRIQDAPDFIFQSILNVAKTFDSKPSISDDSIETIFSKHLLSKKINDLKQALNPIQSDTQEGIELQKIFEILNKLPKKISFPAIEGPLTIEQALACLEEKSGVRKALVVGGLVRDTLIERKSADVDMVCDLPTSQQEALRQLDLTFSGSQGYSVSAHEGFPGLYTISYHGKQLFQIMNSKFLNVSLASPYKEDPLFYDASSRDFFHNAIYADKNGLVYAPFMQTLVDYAYKLINLINPKEADWKCSFRLFMQPSKLTLSNESKQYIQDKLPTLIPELKEGDTLDREQRSRIQSYNYYLMNKVFHSSNKHDLINKFVECGIMNTLYPNLCTAVKPDKIISILENEAKAPLVDIYISFLIAEHADQFKNLCAKHSYQSEEFQIELSNLITKLIKNKLLYQVCFDEFSSLQNYLKQKISTNKGGENLCTLNDKFLKKISTFGILLPPSSPPKEIPQPKTQTVGFFPNGLNHPGAGAGAGTNGIPDYYLMNAENWKKWTLLSSPGKNKSSRGRGRGRSAVNGPRGRGRGLGRGR